MKRSDSDTPAPVFSGVQERVINGLMRRRALTTRTLIRGFGPKANWESLIREKHLIEVRTVYGPVMSLSPAMQDRLGINPRVSGPAALADRAYLNDALIDLQTRGYALLDAEYKKGTAHITRYRMRVPPEQLATAQRLAGNRNLYERQPDGTWPEVPGHPWLYARCSGGGIKLPMLRKIVERHRDDLSVWWSPVIIVVPEEGSIRGYLRELDAKERRVLEGIRVSGISLPHYTPLPTVHLIVQPLPSLITRPSARH